MKAIVVFYRFKSFFSNKFCSKSFLKEGFSKFVEYLELGILERLNLIIKLFSFLLNFPRSADFDGCVKLINKREVIITFLDISEIKINKI